MTAYSIEGKVILITGGCSGLGEATAKAFLENGAKHVAVLDIQENKQLLEDTKNNNDGKRLKCYKCDVTNQNQIDQSIEDIIAENGNIDVVMNFAAILNDEAYIMEIEINFTASVTITLKALNHMRIDKGGIGGTIVNISSIGALNADVGIEGSGMPLPVYCATKCAILHFDNCLAVNRELFYTPLMLSKTTWDCTGVRIMTVTFGLTVTPMLMQPNLGYFADYLQNNFENNANDQFVLQRPDDAVKTVLEAYKTGAHGSTWLSSGGKPPQDITDKIKQAYQILWSCILLKNTTKSQV